MPILPLAILLALTACMIVAKIHLRSGMTLDAILKKFEGDPNWKDKFGNGAIEEIATEE